MAAASVGLRTRPIPPVWSVNGKQCDCHRPLFVGAFNQKYEVIWKRPENGKIHLFFQKRDGPYDPPQPGFPG